MRSAQAEERVQARQKRTKLWSRQGAPDDYGPKGVPDEAHLRRIQARRFDVIENLGHQPVSHCVEVGEGVALSRINDGIFSHRYFSFSHNTDKCAGYRQRRGIRTIIIFLSRWNRRQLKFSLAITFQWYVIKKRYAFIKEYMLHIVG